METNNSQVWGGGLGPESITVICDVCGTEYTIILNVPGCFYCPNCNRSGDYSAGTEDFNFRNDH